MGALLAHHGLLLGGSSSGTADPYFANLVLLLNMEGADGSTTFTDLSPIGRTMTAAGNAQVDTSLGYNAAQFDGTGDRITTPYVTSDFNWWATDFTIEAWVRPTTLANWGYVDGFEKPAMLGCADPSSATNYWSFGPISNGSVVFYYYTGSTGSAQTSASLSANTLTHIAMSKTASGIYLAINGAVEGPTTFSGTPQSSNTVPLTIGQINNRSIDGWIKALRITKAARYTSNFTPPAAPFPTS